MNDLGLKKITRLILVWNIGLLIFAFYRTHEFYTPNLFIILLALVFGVCTKYIVERGYEALFTALGIMLLCLMWFDYEFIGLFAQKARIFTLMDPQIYKLEKLLWNRPLGMVIEEYIFSIPWISIVVMDFFMLCYVTYFALPFYHLLVIYLEKQESEYYFAQRFIFSFIILFMINFTLYMLIPVTGPHYYYKEIYTHPLHFSIFGQRIHNLIVSLQPNFIDCFPSGHSAVSYLIIYWNLRLRLSQAKVAIVICCMIVISTMLLRFHYLLDVLAAIPLVIVAIFVSEKIVKKSSL